MHFCLKCPPPFILGLHLDFVLRMLELAGHLVLISFVFKSLYLNFDFFFFQSLWVRVYSRIHQAQKRLVEDACCTCFVCLLFQLKYIIPSTKPFILAV